MITTKWKVVSADLETYIESQLQALTDAGFQIRDVLSITSPGRIVIVAYKNIDTEIDAP